MQIGIKTGIMKHYIQINGEFLKEKSYAYIFSTLEELEEWMLKGIFRRGIDQLSILLQ